MSPRRAEVRGASARLRLTLSYAGFLLVTGALLLAVVWAFLLRYVPPDAIWVDTQFFPGRDDLVRAFVPRALGALGALLLVGLVGGWILAGRMLAPLERMTKVTRQVSAGALGARIELAGPPDEFRELAEAFDTMLDRLEAHVAEQERFAANASHELRTPLAITQAMLDVARKEPPADSAPLVDRLWTVNARAIELTEALLLLGRSGRRGFAREAVDLSLLVEEAVETLLPRAESRGATIEVAGDPVLAAGSSALLSQVASNLVLNSILHNLPAGGRSTITTWEAGGRALLSVENTGARLSEELVATLTEPFRRGSERTRADDSGVGLGLAIVQSIAQAHDGSLTLRPRPGGGMIAIVALPLATPPARRLRGEGHHGER
ncbi:two-component system sensor histidine kinase VanS [Mycolicibacterium mucogenicum 261Sha1.1M5]|nr:two-component system sensor histidine kinase VanS [Mycolicibacterium mucogenicum 261Sha1.1M5]